MSSEEPAAQQNAPEPDGQAAARRRRRRRRQVRLLSGVVFFWLAMGAALYVVEWPSDASDEVPHSGGSWEEVRAAPLDARGGTAAVWADDGLVVFGGYAPEGAGESPVELRTDGAVWRPSGEWRDMAPPPDGLTLAADGFAVWTGEEVVFGPAIPVDPGDAEPVAAEDAPDGTGDSGSGDASGADEGSGGLVSAEGPAEQAAGLLGYDPETDSWRHVELTGVELTAWRAPGHGYVSHLVGDELVLARPAVGSTEPRVVALDPATGEGRDLPSGPYAPEDADEDGVAEHSVSLAATDGHLVATVDEGTDGVEDGADDTGDASAIWVLDVADPDADWVRGTQPGTTEPLRSGLGAGDLVLYLDGDEALAYDVTDDAWLTLADPPADDGAGPDTGYVWTGEAALAAGQVYDPEADTWGVTPGLPVEDEDVVAGPHVEWTGDAMVVFGGQFLSPCSADGPCIPEPDHPDDLRGWVYIR